MRLAILADAFPPLRSSAAVQIRDLAIEFSAQGHNPLVIVPAPDIEEKWQIDTYRGVSVFRGRTPQTKDIGYLRRSLAEALMPFFLWWRLRQSGALADGLDAVIWYSPSIFHGPLVHNLKRRFGCPTFLILRDIFPEWAVDMGLMGRGIAYRVFKFVEKIQYQAADNIGIQSESVRGYLEAFLGAEKPRIHLLRNWLTDSEAAPCSINIAQTKLAGRKVCVYAGNMGVAQGVDTFLRLAKHLKKRKDIGFLFVGRGSEVEGLRRWATAQRLENVLFENEIEPDEISGLLSQCHVGLLALDPRHTTDNIPGKFITYMRDSLVTLACVNHGNELLRTISDRQLGFATVDRDIKLLADGLTEILKSESARQEAAARCRQVYEELFSPATTVMDIIAHLDPKLPATSTP